MEIPKNEELVQKSSNQNCNKIMKMEEEIRHNNKGGAYNLGIGETLLWA
jgi:hypothetical protein